MRLADVIEKHGIVKLRAAYPAAFEFELGDGRTLTLWPGGDSHGDEWELDGVRLSFEVIDPTTKRVLVVEG